jgi:hypothetical protein
MDYLALLTLSCLLLWFGRVILQRLAQQSRKNILGHLHRHLILPRHHSRKGHLLHHPRVSFVSYPFVSSRRLTGGLPRPQSLPPPCPRPAPRIGELLQ